MLFNTWLGKLKQRYKNSFSAELNPSSCLQTQKSLTLSQIHFLAIPKNLSRNSRDHEQALLIHHPNNFESPFQPSFHNWKSPARLFSSRYHPWQIGIKVTSSCVKPKHLHHSSFGVWILICFEPELPNNI